MESGQKLTEGLPLEWKVDEVSWPHKKLMEVDLKSLDGTEFYGSRQRSPGHMES